MTLQERYHQYAEMLLVIPNITKIFIIIEHKAIVAATFIAWKLTVIWVSKHFPTNFQLTQFGNVIGNNITSRFIVIECIALDTKTTTVLKYANALVQYIPTQRIKQWH